MPRDLTTYPISQNARFKLIKSGFVTKEDLNGFKPNELATETGLTVQEALDVLDIIFPATSANLASDIIGCSALDVLLDEKSQSPITTSCKAFDLILNGGIPLTKVTEICGCPGAGKTQMCLQLCVNVQIPECFGGIDAEAFYIDTEGSFVVQRLAQIANACVNECQNKSKGSDMKNFTVDKILKGVYYYPCKSYVEVIARVNLLHQFLQEHKKVALIVLDSIAFHFRYGFDESYSLRSRLLNGIVQTLVKVANEHKVAVVLTNQMTTKIHEDGSSTLIPALGESWGHACTIRCILSWNEEKRQAHLLKSPSMAEAKANYTITKDGIKDVPSNIAGVASTFEF
ncbi:DNA repair protein RAD51 homolog 3 [Caerostris darwini]|uniref:DNA repair protein RAD51 homolog 3 n=1 Tax=Caerostris darwini TaxID=1538125 RepID=A0AAV4WLM6_9ARAC|nr:DNA repair protein RAD51 homolog 3 [Caerostris darwini]